MHTIASLIWNLFSGRSISPDSRDTAEFWLSIGEFGLVVFAIVVGAGLIGEWRAEKEEKRWIPPRSTGWPWMAIWTWVVVVGIVGELFCDADIWVSSDVQQILSDREISDRKLEIERLKKIAVQERTARLKLEAQISPRWITDENVDKIVVALKPFSGKTVRLESYILDVESALLGRRIEPVFRVAGLKVDPALMTREGAGGIALGVHVTGMNADLVNAIVASLNAAGILASPQEPFPHGGVIRSFGGIINSFGPIEIAPSDAIVFVGVKPINP
jgi:hypothetical protein